MKRHKLQTKDEEEEGFAKRPRRASGKSMDKMAEGLDSQGDTSRIHENLPCQGQKSTEKSTDTERPQSPSPSFISMKSEKSIDHKIYFNQEEKRSQESHQISAAASQEYTLPDLTADQEERLCPEHRLPMEVFCRTDQIPICKQCAILEHKDHNKCYTKRATVHQELQHTLDKIDKDEFVSYLCQHYPECLESLHKTQDNNDVLKRVLETFGPESALKVTLKVMLEKGRNHKSIMDHLKFKLQDHLKSKFESIHEGIAQQGNPILLNAIFTKLLITEGECGGVNREHEVRQIEESHSKDIQQKALKFSDLFKPQPGQRKRIRTVLTKGIAGIGKTVSVQKFILDWAERKKNQDIHFIFPLPFRDLNLKRNSRYSVIQLLHQYFPELKELQTISSEEVKTLFIFDGLDECRLPLDFKNNEMCCDLTQEISVDVLLTNLIQGNILPSALLWITSRPAAASQIPHECVDQVTEIRGLNDSEKEEYFRKRYNKPELADKIVKHIKSSRSLHIMCHIPVFCWISATVLERMLDNSDCADVPKTLTQMYTHFLHIQTHLKNKKYHGVIQDNTELTESDKEMIKKLGKLAFLQLEKGNLIFYEKDLTECGIDVSKASEYSAICTEIFKEESGLYRERVFSFVHLSIQEHLAAVYVQIEFVNNKKNVLCTDPESQSTAVKNSDLHKSAVDRALQSENGHFDLFLRFLLGFSLKSNQVLLSGLLSKHCVESFEETVNYIKEKIRKESSAERTINLFHCLHELNYNALVEEIRNFLSSGRHSETELTPDQCSALAYVLLTSEDVMDEFDLKMWNTSHEGYQRLLPVVKTSRRAILAGTSLTDESCETLSSALKSSNSFLTEMDLSFNDVGDLGIKHLCAGLSDPHCKLEKLTLSHNKLKDIGVKLLCDCIMSPHCKLQKLRLAGTVLSEQSCKLMASVFQTAGSNLKELKLGCSNMRDSGVKTISVGLLSLHCKLEKLGLDRCDLTHESCEALSAVLQSPNSCISDLDLSHNNMGVLGIKQLCKGLTHPNCKLKSIRLVNVGILEETCETLASVLGSQIGSPNLREMDLSNNDLGDSGVKLLCSGLQMPSCKVQKLSLCWCNLTDRCCPDLASALRSSSCLIELEISDNDLADLGVKHLCVGLQDPQCKLQSLNLSGCCVTEEGCSALALALSSNHPHLQELDLSYNHPGESGIRQLSKILDSPQNILKKLSVEHGEQCRLKQGLTKYACEITLDPNTLHRTLSLTGRKKVTLVKDEQPYPDHPDRFDGYAEVLSRETFSGARYYWEVEWTGDVIYVGVTYKSINRKGRVRDCKLGRNNKSWILFWSTHYGHYAGYYNKITLPSPPSLSRRMGVFLDWQAGTVSFYIISPERVYHTYTFHTVFTEPLHAGIMLYNYNDTVTFCDLV